MAEKVSLHFLKPGLQTTIQDLGRLGYQDIGIPINGAMDKGAAKAANWLVGNEVDAPVLEITLLGPQVEITGEAQIAVTGADLSLSINETAANQYETLNVRTGDIIRFGRPLTGCRAYMAVRGKWQITPWLNSASAASGKTAALTPDSHIQKGQTIEVFAADQITQKSIETSNRPDLTNLCHIRVLPGPEFSKLSNLIIGDFFSQNFKISNDSNRMGYKLDGFIRHFDNAQEVISSGIIPGTIQLTNAGQPIILMADAQSSGGYTRIANVVTADLDKLAQMKPGDTVRFILTD